MNTHHARKSARVHFALDQKGAREHTRFWSARSAKRSARKNSARREQFKTSTTQRFTLTLERRTPWIERALDRDPKTAARRVQHNKDAREIRRRCGLSSALDCRSFFLIPRRYRSALSWWFSCCCVRLMFVLPTERERREERVFSFVLRPNCIS